jgi:hypothetical protein
VETLVMMVAALQAHSGPKPYAQVCREENKCVAKKVSHFLLLSHLDARQSCFLPGQFSIDLLLIVRDKRCWGGVERGRVCISSLTNTLRLCLAGSTVAMAIAAFPTNLHSQQRITEGRDRPPSALRLGLLGLYVLGHKISTLPMLNSERDHAGVFVTAKVFQSSAFFAPPSKVMWGNLRAWTNVRAFVSIHIYGSDAMTQRVPASH